MSVTPFNSTAWTYILLFFIVPNFNFVSVFIVRYFWFENFKVYELNCLRGMFVIFINVNQVIIWRFCLRLPNGKVGQAVCGKCNKNFLVLLIRSSYGIECKRKIAFYRENGLWWTHIRNQNVNIYFHGTKIKLIHSYTLFMGIIIYLITFTNLSICR